RKYRLMFGQIEPAMQGGQERRRLSVEQRERIIVEMEMEEVELLVVAFLTHTFQHHHMQRVGVANRAIKTQRFWPSCVKFRGCLRISARKQRDVVPECNQFFRQPMHHSLGAAIEPGWNSLRQWSYLRDAHLIFSFFTIMGSQPPLSAPACRDCNA